MIQHDINVRKIGKSHVLFDKDYICGLRLFKGDGDGALWPFTGNTTWMRYDKKTDADKAAVKLQKYLDVREGQLRKSKA